MAVAFCIHGAANAQESERAAGADAVPAGAANTAEPQIGEVVVSGSRIANTEYGAPTPVAVVGEEQLQRDAKVSIGDSIRELPAVGTSSSPNNGVSNNNIVGGITGLDTVNLRQLGTNRTLVLLDGQRVVQSNITGVVDLGTIPSILVERVDVVTGGASAAWGSDAVAGVVNLVLNKQFDGFKASVEYGDTWEGDHESQRVQLASGIGFADDRGRAIFGANYMRSPDEVFANERDWNKYENLILNPAYTPTNNEPRLIHVQNTGLSQATNGGLIQGACMTLAGCASPIRNSPLQNIQFVGRGATPTQFNPGHVTSGNSVYGDAETDYPATNPLAVPYRSINLFGYTHYDITDNLRASIQINYGETVARNNSTPAVWYGNLPISRENPYLPQSIRDQMTNLGYSHINIGTTSITNLTKGHYSLDNFVNNSVGVPVSEQTRELMRGVVSLDGRIGPDWTWNAYYQYGEVNTRVETESNVVRQRYLYAVDAVRLPTGEIVCRAVRDGIPGAAGCVPLNVIGEGNATYDAIRYVNVRPGENWEEIKPTQDVVALSAQGKLPFGLPAGLMSMAFGAEYRREEAEITTDPGAAARQYFFANFIPFDGKYSVKEGFIELDVPLLEDSFVDTLGLNVAGRLTDYSTSGSVETWKVGLTSEVNSMLRLRGTVSRDIRAANLNELFSAGNPVQSRAVDPNTGLSVPIFSTSRGNPELDPEIADTLTAGIVLNPISGLNLSLDYYAIEINDAIASVNSTTVINRCAAGETVFCSQLLFNGANGALSEVVTFPRNLSSDKTSGFDFQVDYRMPLGSGDLISRLVGNYILEQEQSALGVTTDYAGALGRDSAVLGIPKLRATLTETYSVGPFSGTLQGRYVGSGKLVNGWTAKDVDDNTIPSVFYVDLRGSYEVADGVTVYGAIDNMFDRDPPNVATSYLLSASTFSTAIRADIHDQLGRAYRLGVRVTF
jgi:iron complex outermembrane recepter protein